MNPSPVESQKGGAVSQVRSGSRLSALAVSIRPYQWVKNILVFGGLIFSRSLWDLHAVALSLGAFVVFCLASSGVYLLNDLRDVERDRQHPLKRLRPLAAGLLSSRWAGIAAGVLLTLGILVAFGLNPRFGGVLVAYVALNLAYTVRLKYIVILDVMMVALGFVLRAVAGAVVIGVTASPWLILCTFMLALLVGFGKRRNELTLLNEEAGNHRKSLEGYSVQFLDLMMAISACSAVITYALYSMAPETVARFKTNSLVLTTPWVLYGVFRYLYLVHKCDGGGDPARLLVNDISTLLNIVLWVLTVCLILYGPSRWLPW